MTTPRPTRGTAIAAPAREARPRTAAPGAGARASGGPPPTGWWALPEGRRFFMLVYALALLGVVFVFSSSFPRAGRPTSTDDPFYYFRHQLVALVLGFVAMMIVSRLSLRQLQWGSLGAMAVGMLLVLALFKFGTTVNGARNWMSFGPIRFQPAELTKVAYIGFMATLMACRSSFRERWQPLAWMGGVTALLVLVLIKQNDLGMAMLIMGTALGMAILGGMKLRYWFPSLLGILTLGLLAAHMEPYRWARLQAYWDLENHRSGVGYHVYGMLISLARGGPLGTGFGMSRDKWTTLPVPHTDSIFCVIGGELGLWGGLGVIALLTLVVVWAFQIARHSPDRLGWYMAAGSGLALGLQSFINIGVATATIPVTGLTLPFISYGGTSLIACLLSAGMVLAVASASSKTVAK